MNYPASILRRFLYCLLAVSFTSQAGAQIESVGIAGDDEFTRIVVTAPQEISPGTILKPDENGNVLVFIMPGLAMKADVFLGKPMGAVAAYTLDGDRILFELRHPVEIARQFELPPDGQTKGWRLIVDLQARSKTPSIPAGTQKITRQSAPGLPQSHPAISTGTATVTSPSLKPSQLQTITAPPRRHVVIIDPGHGGKDPGAISAAGYRESRIVLDTARILKELMAHDDRYDVRLTRANDVYVEHEDRIAKARNWGADLFISIHADAAARPDVAGASVYTISTRGEARIEGTARKYGWELPLEDGTPEAVSDILQDLTVRETKSNSVIFAEILVPELGQAGPLLRNTHRRKNLFVLLAPDVPAVLVEIGFLTNTADSRRLNSRNGRRKTAQAIKRAIETYFDRQDMFATQK